MVKSLAIVQARMGSIRCPGKVMREVSGIPLIQLLLQRLRHASSIDQIVVATTTNSVDDELEKFVVELGVDVFRGDENDVLNRFYQAAGKYKAEIVVRITGDCPLIDASVVDSVVDRLCQGDLDYVSNVAPPTFPDGLDVEAFTYSALESAWNDATESNDREHVTPFLRANNGFSKANVSNDVDYSTRRWTVDEDVDFETIRNVFDHFGTESLFGWKDVIAYMDQSPEKFDANQSLVRNEGASMGTGQKLWTRATKVIPGGNSLLSKRAEMFLPEKWPAYFSKAKGCRVWDLDGRELIDMSIMGIGTNILGYGNTTVDNAVRRVIDNGNMSTLNCPEEVELAERLVGMHNWAEMARFARTGGEANAIAVRIARAASGRDGVAICGYHGWHDWYLATNLSDENGLASHLLPGLDPTGVPKNLRGTVFPFQYNQLEQLEAIVAGNEIGVIKMEVMRNDAPQNGFLTKIRELATKNNIVLIFDECTSGFRETFGGLHKKFSVDPDMAIFGKTLGNGYAISAVIGRESVMQAAQSTFISSTFWTERIGPAAAIAALNEIESTKAYEQITEIGNTVLNGWKSLASAHNLQIQTFGLPALAGYSFVSPNHLKYKTLITQEMLKKGFLASTIFYACTSHSQDLIDRYFSELGPIFETIAECESGKDIDSLLDGPVCHSGFRRLN